MCAYVSGGMSAAGGVRPWFRGPMNHRSECRCVSECVIISEDQAGLAGKWMKWPGSERGALLNVKTSVCL